MTSESMDARLQRFCRTDRRNELATPFAAVWGGRSWGFGSDGVRMLLIEGAAVNPENRGLPVDGILAPFGASALWTQVDLAEIAEFVGVPSVWPMPCKACGDARWTMCFECEGSGEVPCFCRCGDEHTQECPRCRGRRESWCHKCSEWRETNLAERRVRIGDALLDAALVAGSLVDAEQTSGRAEWFSSGGLSAQAIRGDGWMLVFMPCLETGNLPAPIPEFALSAASANGAREE